ncbi:MAG: hypothetical protein ACO1SX_06660 [Actinomycetota bacterium]
MRLDSSILDPLAEAAGLSPQEKQCLRLWCGRGLDGRDLAEALNIKPGAASVVKSHVRRKIREAQATYEALDRKRRAARLEQDDAVDLSRPGGMLRFILDSMAPPAKPEASRQLIGPDFIWTEVWDDVDCRMALAGAVHAGPLVSPDGEHRGLTAVQNRAKIAEMDARLKKKHSPS